MILLDEPCSALDPISTAKIEELIDELEDTYTIAIVTHNMQQAARVSDYTAFMYLGELVEFDDTNKIFTSPTRQAHPRLHHRPFRLRVTEISSWPTTSSGPTTRNSRRSSRKIAEMGGIAEKMLSDAMDALADTRRSISPSRSSRPTRGSTRLQREIEEQRDPDDRAAAADGDRSARDRRPPSGVAGDLERVGDLAKNIAKRALKIAVEPRVPRAIVGLKHMNDSPRCS